MEKEDKIPGKKKSGKTIRGKKVKRSQTRTEYHSEGFIGGGGAGGGGGGGGGGHAPLHSQGYRHPHLFLLSHLFSLPLF